MCIRLGVLVGCVLFLLPNSRAEDGKTALPPDGRASPRAVNDPLPVDPGSPNDRRKNRYISFKPNNIMGETAKLEVTLTASVPHPGSVGTSWWVQAPVAPGNPILPAGECVALLGAQATAADMDWVAAGCTVLHVTGCPIEPTSDYDVRAVAGADVSNPLAVPTILRPIPKFWGDLVGFFTGVEWNPPNGFTNIDDVVAILKTWQAGPVVAPVFNTVHLSVADVEPGNINLVVNYNDLYQVILAFIGGQYPYGPAGPDGGCNDNPGVNGQGAEIRFFPVRSAPLGSPVGTLGASVTPQFNAGLGCWEVLVEPGVEVDLNLHAFGWSNAVGSPTLGAIQGTVVSAGYSNGVGGNLNPKGWPDNPENGAYRPQNACAVGGDGSLCVPPFDTTCDGGANGFCLHNPDWVMPQCAQDIPAVATPTLDYGWGTAALSNCNTDDGMVKTMGGLILEVPVDAVGTYLIDLDPDPNNTFMTSGAGTPITGITLTPACITIAELPCCLPDGSCVNLVTAECENAGGIQACECGGDDDLNGVDDACEADCDLDQIPDLSEIDNCPPGNSLCNDCNQNCIPDECDIDPSDPDGNGEVSGDNDGDGVPNECDNCLDIPNPGQEDQNDDGQGDACTGACCTVLNGNFLCLYDTPENCDILTGGSGVFQGLGTFCPTEGVNPASHFGVVVTHVTNTAQVCGGGGGRTTCSPGDPIDPWQTALDADICHQFGVGPESPAIPADFFGPGSDPFTGQVCLAGMPLGLTPEGEFGDADTLVRRTGGPAGNGDPFDRCDLPSDNEVIVNAEVVALSLVSVAPVIVTFNGGQNPESWDVVVGLSAVTPPPGTITAVKTHCNGGTYNSELHVQPKFTFTKVSDPNTSEELDTGLAGIPFVTLVQDTDPHWTSDVSETFGLASTICTDFHPGIEDTEPTVNCDCNANGVSDECDLGATAALSPNIEIPDCPSDGMSDPSAVSTIVVTDGGIVKDLRVSLRIDHTYVGDLLITLRHDDTGTEVALMSRVGLDEVGPFCSDDQCCGCDQDDVDCSFDDTAILDVEDACPPVGGTAYLPNAGASGLPSALSTFNGESATGSWTLSVFDGANIDTGTLLKWSLILISNDVNSSGVPDDCEVQPPIRATAPHDILKNRYISIDPRGAFGSNPDAHHIRVKVDSSEVNGLMLPVNPWWATAPVNGQPPSPATCISVLSPNKPATEPDWAECPTVHLTGCPIVPTTTYAIAVEAGGELSADALFGTQAKPGAKWIGDVVGNFTGPEGDPPNVWTAPNGTVNIDDAFSAIKTFSNPNASNATHLSVTDIHPVLNGEQMTLLININDALIIIKGFGGDTYGEVASPFPDDEIPDLTECP